MVLESRQRKPRLATEEGKCWGSDLSNGWDEVAWLPQRTQSLLCF